MEMKRTLARFQLLQEEELQLMLDGESSTLVGLLWLLRTGPMASPCTVPSVANISVPLLCFYLTLPRSAASAV
jgi:hypothetical protein